MKYVTERAPKVQSTQKMLPCATYLISYLYMINSFALILQKKAVNLIELTMQLLWKNTNAIFISPLLVFTWNIFLTSLVASPPPQISYQVT